MICSTLLPLTPKSLPPFGGQTQPAHVLLKFADSRRALPTVQRYGFMVAGRVWEVGLLTGIRRQSS